MRVKGEQECAGRALRPQCRSATCDRGAGRGGLRSGLEKKLSWARQQECDAEDAGWRGPASCRDTPALTSPPCSGTGRSS